MQVVTVWGVWSNHNVSCCPEVHTKIGSSFLFVCLVLFFSNWPWTTGPDTLRQTTLLFLLFLPLLMKMKPKHLQTLPRSTWTVDSVCLTSFRRALYSMDVLKPTTRGPWRCFGSILYSTVYNLLWMKATKRREALFSRPVGRENVRCFLFMYTYISFYCF